MDNQQRSFEERLYKEYDLAGRVRLATVLSMILYPSFLLLDAIYSPQYLRLFIIIRLSVVIICLLFLALLKRTKTNRGFINLGMAIALVDAVGIAIMIQVMGGFLTSYYQGLNLSLIHI